MPPQRARRYWFFFYDFLEECCVLRNLIRWIYHGGLAVLSLVQCFLAQTQECRDLCCVVLKDFPGFPSDVTPCLVLRLLFVLVKQYQSNDLGCRISLCCKAFFFVFFLHFEQMTAIKLLLHRSEYCLKHGWNVGSFTFSNGVFCNMSVIAGLEESFMSMSIAFSLLIQSTVL